MRSLAYDLPPDDAAAVDHAFDALGPALEAQVERLLALDAVTAHRGFDEGDVDFGPFLLSLAHGGAADALC